MRSWLFRKSEPRWGALPPTHRLFGWGNSKLSYCLVLMLLYVGARIRCGLEARDQFGSDPHRQALQPLGDNFEKAQGDFFFHINYHILGWAEDSEKNL